MFKVSDYEQSTGAYLKEIGGFKPLTKKDEMKLWRRLKKNPEDSDAKNKLITSNLKFVVSVANSYKGRGLSMSDLVAEGNMGLLKAYTKFDPKRDVKFISYSVHWIRQSILEALQKRNSIDSEDLPLDYEKQEAGVDEDYLEADNTPNLVNFVENVSDSEIERAAKQKQALRTLFTSLTEREKNIIIRYFGINGHEGETLEEIGDTMNLTKERVRQIKEDGMKKLRSFAMECPDVMKIYSEYVMSEN
jgi:RNA polymerase primary sigma factor